MNLEDFVLRAKGEGFSIGEIRKALEGDENFKKITGEGFAPAELFQVLRIAPVPGKNGELIERAAAEYKIDPYMLYSLGKVESGDTAKIDGKPVKPPGPRTDEENWPRAKGWAQLMPATAKALGVTDPYDVNQAIPAAAKLLRQNLDSYGGDVEKALKAYHAGPDTSGWGPLTNAYPKKIYKEWEALGGTPVQVGEFSKGPGWGAIQNLSNGYLQGFGLEASAAGQVAKKAWELNQQGVGPLDAVKTAAKDFGYIKDAYAGAKETYAKENPLTAATTEIGGSVAGQLPLLAAAGVPQMAKTASGVANPIGRFFARTGAGGIAGAESALLSSRLGQTPVADQVTQGTVLGGAMGSMVEPVIAKAWAKSFGNEINPQTAKTALGLRDAGVPVRVGQVPGAGWVPEKLERMFHGKAEAGPEFVRAVSRTLGEDTDEITSAVLRQVKDREGQALESLAQPYTLPNWDVSFYNKIVGLKNEVSTNKTFSDSSRKAMENLIEKVRRTFLQGGITGKEYRELVNFNGEIGKDLRSSDGNVRYFAKELREALEDGFGRVMSGDDRAAYELSRLRYRTAMTLDSAVDDATAKVDPKRLLSTVERSFGAADRAGDIGPLALGQDMLERGGKSRLSWPTRLALGSGALYGGLAAAPQVLENPKLLALAGTGIGLAGAAQGAYSAMTGKILRNALDASRAPLAQRAAIPMTQGVVRNLMEDRSR